MQPRKMIVLAHVFILLLSTASGQFFPATDGFNDLFAILTHCNIRPRFPTNNNEVVCYRTDPLIRNGITTCSPRLAIQREVSVGARTQNYTIFFAHTPGRLRNRRYSNRLLCRWNMRCPAGQLMYLDVAEHEIETPARSPFFRNPICLDYLRISRDFGDQLTCGSVSPLEGLEPNRLLVEFRSNRGIRFPGFKLRIVCFNPIQQDGAGCTVTSGTGTVGRRSVQQSSDGPTIPLLNRAPRHNRAPRSGKRFIQKTIPKGAWVIYTHREVTVKVNNIMILWVDNIMQFTTFNEFDGVETFNVNDGPKEFRGFGVMTIVDDSVTYAIYGVDPRFMPSNDEMNVIRKLLDAEERLVVDDDFVIEDEEDTTMTPPTQAPGQMPGQMPMNRGQGRRRDRRQAQPEVINIATGARNSCNAILRSVAESILGM